jgi:hypothetical protein
MIGGTEFPARQDGLASERRAPQESQGEYMTPVVAVICCEEGAASFVTQLIGAGFTTRAYHRTTTNVEALARLGAIVTNTPREAADGADVILVLCRHSLILVSVLDNGDGVLAGSRTGSLIINMGTLDVARSRATEELVKARGLRYVEAVFWGDPTGMEAPTAIMVGGAANDFASASSLLRAISQKVTHVGPIGQAIFVKFAVDCILQCSCALAVEECIEPEVDPLTLAGLMPEFVSLARQGHETLESIIRSLPQGEALTEGVRKEARSNRQEILEIVRREISKRMGLVNV